MSLLLITLMKDSMSAWQSPYHVHHNHVCGRAVEKRQLKMKLSRFVCRSVSHRFGLPPERLPGQRTRRLFTGSLQWAQARRTRHNRNSRGTVCLPLPLFPTQEHRHNLCSALHPLPPPGERLTRHSGPLEVCHGIPQSRSWVIAESK